MTAQSFAGLCKQDEPARRWKGLCRPGLLLTAEDQCSLEQVGSSLGDEERAEKVWGGGVTIFTYALKRVDICKRKVATKLLHQINRKHSVQSCILS